MKTLKSLFGMLAVAVLFLPVAVFAQEVTLSDVMQDGIKAVATWQTVGWLAGMIAAVNALTNLTKLPAMASLLDSKAWLRPAVAAVLGALLGGLTTLASGAGPFAAMLAGLFAGLGSTGFHELVSLFNPTKQLERATGSKVVEVVKDGPAVLALKVELTRIESLPSEKERLDALAAWANGGAK